MSGGRTAGGGRSFGPPLCQTGLDVFGMAGINGAIRAKKYVDAKGHTARIEAGRAVVKGRTSQSRECCRPPGRGAVPPLVLREPPS